MKNIPLLGTSVILMVISLPVLADPIVFSGLSAANITTSTTDGGYSQWTSGSLDLSGNSIGPGVSIELTLNLDGNVTTAPAGPFPRNSYGAGIVVDPAVAPDAKIFGFTYQLLENGVAVGSSFGFDLVNPFGFSVTQVGTGIGGVPAGVTFNGVDVTIYNDTLTESVSSFQVYVGVPYVPDTSSTVSLLALGMLAMAGFGAWKNAIRCSN